MIMRRRLWALAVALLLALSVRADAQPPKMTNEFCPILHDRKAVPEHWSDYKGRRIYFCCDDCKQTFDQNPQGVSLPPAPIPVQPAGGHVHGPGYAEWAALLGGGTAGASGEGPGSGRPFLIAGMAVVLLGLVAARLRRVPMREVPKHALGVIVILALWSLPWISTLQSSRRRVVDLEKQLSALGPLQKEKALDQIHYATFIEYGTPPRPRRSPLGPRLSATYYRGNDERSPKLFNGGNYRTATFHLSVRDDKGERKAGDALSGPVFIRLEIVRAAFTPDHFWSKNRLGKIYLTADPAPDAGWKKDPADRTGLVETEPTQRWRADYPLGAVAASTKGVIYVREQFTQGARFHFALEYDLQIENGRLGPKSDLFMGSLYRTRALTLDVLPANEWFSHLPIPEKPAVGTTDPKLLGIDTDKRPYSR